MSHELGDVSIVFFVEFYLRMGHFRENFGNVQIGQNDLNSKGTFWVNFLNSPDSEETAIMGVFEVAKFESVLKIEVT